MAHNYPTALDTVASLGGVVVDNVTAHAASDINDLRNIVVELEEKVGVDNSAVTTTLDYLVNNFFEAGRKLWLYEDAAPTGWTYVGSVADRVLAVKGGANAFNVAGGNQAGTWTQPGHQLTINEMPSHRHSYQSGGEGGYAVGGQADLSVTAYTAFTGGSASHNHGSTWRPYGAVGIIVEKD